jgi:UDP-2,3-diacylglucosamine pyrophosphatase LpxH
MPRKIEICVISDVHLGTYGCQAKELNRYLKSIHPETLILNGDFIDIWQFKKNYFPKFHLKIIKKIVDFASKGTQVIYITGNHDEMLRKFTDFHLGNIEIVNKKILHLNGQKVWIFHGDVFDASVQHSKWIARVGSWGYDFLIRLNVLSNWVLQKMGRGKYSFSKKIKASVKKAVKFIGDFEETASELAIENGYDFVICGHIHQPQIRKIEKNGKNTVYLNSGDWVENLTALEYHNGQWALFEYHKDFDEPSFDEKEDPEIDLQNVENLIKDIAIKNMTWS